MKGLSPQTVKSYLAALRFIQVAAGLGSPPREDWPRLRYVVRGINRSRSNTPQKRRLPITAAVLHSLGSVWSSDLVEDEYTARLLWAACCLGYFCCLRSGEFTSSSSTPSVMRRSDVAVDSHSSPSVVKIMLRPRKSKTDPFGRGVELFAGRTGRDLCPVTALLNYLAIRSKEDGPLFILQDGRPLSRDLLVKKVRYALGIAGFQQDAYSGHGFRIGAASSAAAAGVPDHLIKAMGRWNSEAYLLYVKTPPETLASISRALAV